MNVDNTNCLTESDYRHQEAFLAIQVPVIGKDFKVNSGAGVVTELQTFSFSSLISAAFLLLRLFELCSTILI